MLEIRRKSLWWVSTVNSTMRHKWHVCGREREEAVRAATEIYFAKTLTPSSLYLKTHSHNHLQIVSECPVVQALSPVPQRGEGLRCEWCRCSESITYNQ